MEEFIPLEIIQHIQSFLDEKEAARSSLLSKLWYKAWSQHPNLCLDKNNFSGFHQFTDFARRRIKRYQDLNIKLHSLRLVLDGFVLASLSELICDALLLGLNHLTLRLCHHTVPPQVFTSVSLEKIDISRCAIHLPLTSSGSRFRVLCSNLLSLNLNCVRMANATMADILVGCPLLEDLTLANCIDLTKINLSVVHSKLKRFQAKVYYGNLLVEWEEATRSQVNVQHQYHNLISLELVGGVEVENLFFRFLSHRFPCLQELKLRNCRLMDSVDVEMASDSLKYLSLIPMCELKSAKIHVPNIHKFTFTTQTLFKLSLTTACVNWESDLKFIHPVSDVNSRWFLEIRDILQEVSSSEISLVINLSSACSNSGNIIALIPPASPFVENLKIEFISPDTCESATLFGWLLCCRPKFITWFDKWKQEGRSCEGLERVYNELKKHVNKITSNILPCIHGLKEVDMEYYEESLRKWQSAPHEAACKLGQMRLRLKWLNIIA